MAREGSEQTRLEKLKGGLYSKGAWLISVL